METKNAILGRRSIRSFLPRPIEADVIRTVLDEARWAPSWGNSQAWSVYVITGDALSLVKAAYMSKIREGDEAPTDLEMPSRNQWPEHVLARMNLTRPGETFQPPPGPSIWEMYGAPCLLVFAVDRGLVPHYATFDAGLLVENVCLAAFDAGLGTVIMAMGVRYPEVLREVLPGTGTKSFVIGVAMGYPSQDAPVNSMPRQRADLDDIVTWVS
ncbi:MAG: nitroreductase [Coriobacteriia bacterium]|nr:nitroreductase [Coriobacteriia bacterium]